MTGLRFPFGQPVLPRTPEITEPRGLLILGAYPSALHVIWHPPTPYKQIQAVAVDNEPDFFWNGFDEQIQFNNWLDKISFNRSWGRVEPAGKFNGSSGSWVNERVINPLGMSRGEAWLSDCLDLYRCSDDLARRISDTYSRLPPEFGLPRASLLPHPNEDEIVTEALRTHLARLKNEIALARPEIIVTLGNAALRVLSKAFTVKGEVPNKLSSAPQDYGKRLSVEINEGKYSQWIPLAHPAAPPIYQQAHAKWLKSVAA